VPHKPRQLGENVEINLLAEENPAHSKVFFRETAMFRDPEPPVNRPRVERQ
jgi:hypothetical protein